MATTSQVHRRGRSATVGWPLALALLTFAAAPLGAAAQTLPPYDAKAAMMKVGPDPERPDAEIFHIAYTMKGADPAKRPVTFVFNGGPGAASIYLHIAAIGPKTIASVGDGSLPSSPARLETNPDSWLIFTDLVFVDPVGTGYSRMLPGPDGAPRDPRPYFSIEGDVNALAGFMRQWLTTNKRWGSPKAIAGESYAGHRITALSKVLAFPYGINLNRAILISPEMNVPTLRNVRGYDLLHPITLLPTQAAVAAYHGLSSVKNDAAGRKAAEDFALSGYLTGLAKLGQMDEKEQAAFYERVGKLIGLDPALVALHRGRVPEEVFAANLLASKGKFLDTFDGTQASDNPNPEKRDTIENVKSISVLTGILLAPFMDYIQKDLGYLTDRPYNVLALEVSAMFDRSERELGGPENLAVSLTLNPDLKALVLHGYHDIGANYFLSRYLLEQTVRSASARERLSFKNYVGGHMFYFRKDSRSQMAVDVRRFFED